ncbi:pteridine reductase [Nannocystis exedens]|uniref:Pteridine reductase n=1 Tax=Nannocystis exedens TaxID=54 RepID=A0A1I2AGY2_9BACT|nr:SDR family oxidoreductase [Nannocystis exedens]PCC69823.1 pteridine reductase [Nannocystis exedens]SFE42967.1 pteridine reductase [Nannocystis exedens]
MEDSEQVAPIALVTGAAVRVGRAILTRLAGAGYRVWLHYHRSEAAAAELAEELGARCVGTIQADLAAEPARAALAVRVLDPQGPAGGRLDLLVNSAASFERGEFTARSDDDLRRVLEVNLVAPLSLVRALAPALTAARGAVVNILDVAGLQPWRGYLDHCTAKAALLMATKALAIELAPAVRVNGVAPGTVAWPEEGDPRFAEGSEIRARIMRAIPLRRIGTPEDVAETVLFLARSAFVSGQVIAVDGGRSAAGGVAGG